MKKTKVCDQVRSYLIITLACVMYALSFDWFYAPNDFTIGGFTGISQIINFSIPVLPVGVMIIVLNVPLFGAGLKKFGFAFLMKSIALGKEKFGLPELDPVTPTHFIR